VVGAGVGEEEAVETGEAGAAEAEEGAVLLTTEEEFVDWLLVGREFLLSV
jgi:hypothetical protein